MLKQEDKPCWVVVCDGCGSMLDADGEGGIYHCHDEADAKQTAQNCDWRVDDDGRVECVGCWEERDERLARTPERPS